MIEGESSCREKVDFRGEELTPSGLGATNCFWSQLCNTGSTCLFAVNAAEHVAARDALLADLSALPKLWGSLNVAWGQAVTSFVTIRMEMAGKTPTHCVVSSVEMPGDMCVVGSIKSCVTFYAPTRKRLESAYLDMSLRH